MLKNYINGEFTDEGTSGSFSKINPSNETIIAEVNNTVIDGVELAVNAARKAFNGWRKVSRPNRGEYFRILANLVKEYADSIIECICLDTGKNRNEALAEVNETIHMLEITHGRGRMSCGELVPSEISDKIISVERKPRGIIAVISPFNFCLAIGAAWGAAPAILEGNCVVHKPSQLTPLTSNIMTELYHKAGFPAGVYNMIQGQDEAGKLLVEHSDINYVLFTGSAEVGKKIRQHCATEWNKGCSLEMGSKSGVIIMDDANLDIALDACINSAYKLAGQRCVSAGRILVQRNVLDIFIQRFLPMVQNIKIGDPIKEGGVFYGPVISKESVVKIEFYNDLVRKDKDCKILIDGGRVNRPGYFMSPFVYLCEWGNKRFLKEEVFGSNLGIIPFDTIDDAISIYNDTDFGLSCACITNNFRTMKRLKEDIDTGMIYFNAGTIGAESSCNFQGIKASGYGHGTATGTFDAVVHKMTVTTNHADKIEWAQGLK